jgi:small subunit ribosomal protein S8
MSIDTVGNFLTEIRNALLVSSRSITVRTSKMKEGVVQVLKDEGYIRDFKKFDGERSEKFLTIYLKYVDGESVIHYIKRVSKPGCRYYAGIKNVEPVIGQLGISILSTNAGIMSDRQAKKLSVGGEVVCQVW